MLNYVISFYPDDQKYLLALSCPHEFQMISHMRRIPPSTDMACYLVQLVALQMKNQIHTEDKLKKKKKTISQICNFSLEVPIPDENCVNASLHEIFKE